MRAKIICAFAGIALLFIATILRIIGDVRSHNGLHLHPIYLIGPIGIFLGWFAIKTNFKLRHRQQERKK
jgi:uncharacterized membrane protein